jgi:hypothetical protein
MRKREVALGIREDKLEEHTPRVLTVAVQWAFSRHAGFFHESNQFEPTLLQWQLMVRNGDMVLRNNILSELSPAFCL